MNTTRRNFIRAVPAAAAILAIPRFSEASSGEQPVKLGEVFVFRRPEIRTPSADGWHDGDFGVVTDMNPNNPGLWLLINARKRENQQHYYVKNDRVINDYPRGMFERLPQQPGEVWGGLDGEIVYHLHEVERRDGIPRWRATVVAFTPLHQRYRQPRVGEEIVPAVEFVRTHCRRIA